MKFSIIIPTYNRSDMVMPTLDSIFKQSFSDYEIIVVDNCSTDNTEEVLKPLVDAGKIKFIKHDKNYERAKSRNTGMENAQGDFVTFLDSDDFLYPDCLKDANEYANQHPEKKIFHCLYELVDSEVKPLKQYPFPKIKVAKDQILLGNFLACIGVFIDRDVYSKMRFDTSSELTGSEDHEFWIRVLGQFPDLGRINKINAGIQEHPNRTMNQTNIEGSLSRKMYIYRKLATLPELLQAYPGKASLYKAYAYTFTASASLDAKKNGQALSYLSKAVKTDLRIISNNFFMKVLILCFTKF